jgi:hypothetical protein
MRTPFGPIGLLRHVQKCTLSFPNYKKNQNRDTKMQEYTNVTVGFGVRDVYGCRPVAGANPIQGMIFILFVF